MNELESCEICGEPTGRAGKDDDSLYAEWASAPPNLPYGKAGDEIGPLCEDCYDDLSAIGALKED